jgi:Spy/CpxP family protein refolding chaperone
MALVSLAIVFATPEQPVLGAEGKTVVKKVLGRKGRHLPAHYAQVITEKQREEIYKIEDEYQPKIETLQKQLDALKNERDEKVSALLTPEQKKQIEEAAAKAKANRKSKGQPTAKPCEQTPATPPVAPASPPTAPAPGK